MILAGLMTVAAIGLIPLSALASGENVSVVDAAAILSHVSEKAGSGNSSAGYDAALILQYTVGLIDHLPIVEPPPASELHVHEWTMHEASGHFETQKIGEEEVAAGTYWVEIGGWDEDRAAYYQCNDCGAAFSSNLAASEHITSVYHSSYSYYPAETVHHDGEWVKQTRYETRDVYGDVWVIDQEAYWICSCGETRNTQP